MHTPEGEPDTVQYSTGIDVPPVAMHEERAAELRRRSSRLSMRTSEDNQPPAVRCPGRRASCSFSLLTLFDVLYLLGLFVGSSLCPLLCRCLSCWPQPVAAHLSSGIHCIRPPCGAHGAVRSCASLTCWFTVCVTVLVPMRPRWQARGSTYDEGWPCWTCLPPLH